MNAGKTIDSEEYLKQKLVKKEFRKEWEALEAEYKIAREIIRLRSQAGLTQKELAKRAKTSQSAIARIESGTQNISIKMLYRIGEALGAVPEVRFVKSKAVRK